MHLLAHARIEVTCNFMSMFACWSLFSQHNYKPNSTDCSSQVFYRWISDLNFLPCTQDIQILAVV